jgi:cation diffusion facilitator CzcD-associated flavoprotein CzcO
MAVGQLSDARRPPFDGLDQFQGAWVQTSHWPEHGLELAGRRVGVIGTGSSGVQTVTAVAPVAEHLYVFQRTANYSVPAHNGPMDAQRWAKHSADVAGLNERMLHSPTGSNLPVAEASARELTPAERGRWLEERWAQGGHAMNLVFTDQGTDWEANGYVSEFVREKIRSVVRDRTTAAALLPTSYPIGTRRLIVDTGYYESFNRDNVTLVDINADPIQRVTRTGIQTRERHYELDVIVFALGFNAFTGSLDKANIRNEYGSTPSDNWRTGPQTYLGLMTTQFPNLFNLTGPGSPSVLANMVLGNVFQVDFLGDLLAHMGERGYHRVEPTESAQDGWTRHVADASSNLLRRVVDNYMVHVNEDGSRIFIPYIGGLGRYVETCHDVAADGYRGFAFA